VHFRFLKTDREIFFMQKVEKPIFIVGTGRCGSTIFHQIFSHHPQVAWLSRYCDRHPGKLHYNRMAMQLLNSPLPTRYVRKLVYPVEAYRFWDYYCAGGFSKPCRDLLREDVMPKTEKAVQKAMAAMLTGKRTRLLIKITGWPRMGFLKEIFPDAKFIHVYRDGRAVVNSWLGVNWWLGWRGPSNWQWGELTAEQQAKWEKYDCSFVALAAICWEILMAAQECAKQRTPSDDLLEVRYEDLCQDPIGIFQTVTEFCGLAWSPGFKTIVSQFSLRNTNDKWKKELSEAQQKILCECLADTLEKYGYN
jgi:hypothetical protein